MIKITDDLVDYITDGLNDNEFTSYVVNEVLKKADEYQRVHSFTREELMGDGFEPGRWWQAVSAEGKLFAETSDPSDFEQLELLDKEGVKFYRYYTRQLRAWAEADPKAEIERRKKEGPRLG
jgi:hypothetical protein